MKIGILTFHCAHNYGAVLQAYGLKEYLLNLGHEVYMIDYRPSYLMKPYGLFSRQRWIHKQDLMRNFIFNVMRFKDIKRRWMGFQQFINQFPLLSISKIDMVGLDAVFIGSDQVWSTKLCRGFDSYFWGEAFRDKPIRMISYAASSGASVWNDRDREQVRKLLQNFSSVSVRENTLKNTLSLLTNREVVQVLDPTLIAGCKAFEKIAIAPSIKEKYVLIYEVYHMPKVYSIAHRIAEKIGAKVVSLEAFPSFQKKDNALIAASPREFVGLFKNAAAVVTNSFHGTAFSIIFKRPFYTVALGSANDCRSASLLSALGLTDRMIDDRSNVAFSEVDFDIAYKLLAAEQGKSREFIIKSLV